MIDVSKNMPLSVLWEMDLRETGIRGIREIRCGYSNSLGKKR